MDCELLQRDLQFSIFYCDFNIKFHVLVYTSFFIIKCNKYQLLLFFVCLYWILLLSTYIYFLLLIFSICDILFYFSRCTLCWLIIWWQDNMLINWFLNFFLITGDRPALIAPPESEWYHGRLDRYCAEQRLRTATKLGSYLGKIWIFK